VNPNAANRTPKSRTRPETISGTRLSRAADAAVTCLGVGGKDRVAVVCNEPQRVIAEALATAASARTPNVSVTPFPASTRPNQEPPAAIAAAMAAATVVFATTAFSISHTAARRNATALGVRIASLPKITSELFERLLVVDYAHLQRAGEALAAKLTAATTCRVTSPAGTDVTLELRDRVAVCDAGNLQAPGAFGNLPAGEAYVAPIETTGDGQIVFDGSLAGYGVLPAPVTVTLRDGRAISASGEDGRWLLDTLGAGGNTGRLIAELGIGTKPNARHGPHPRRRESGGHRPPRLRHQRLLRASQSRRCTHRRTAPPTHDHA
jgi:leucyl aminopeptidase (aminopeptidase T)